MPELKRLPRHLAGRGPMAGIALYAALMEQEGVQLELGDPPPSHLEGPIFLNVRRYFDLPQALALAMDKPVELIFTNPRDAERWAWPRQLQDALGQKSLKFR